VSGTAGASGRRPTAGAAAPSSVAAARPVRPAPNGVRATAAGHRSAAGTPRAVPGARSPAPPVLPKGKGPEFVRELEKVSQDIQDPVAKLRYLRRSLAEYEQTEHQKAAERSSIARLASRVTGIGEPQPLFPGYVSGARYLSAVPRRRSSGRALGLAVALAVVSLVAAAYYGLRPTPAAAVDAGAAGTAAAPAQPQPSGGAEALPTLPAAVTPDRIWRVESGPGWELYSNGLRVDTTYAVTSEARRYRVFTAAGMSERVLTEPAGILFHTTESDIWPLEESFNEKLLDSSQDLLRYLKRNRVYHYLIDRFGRVFRVVDETGKANHAGHSVWSRGDDVYLNLNHAFLGVSFETRWEGGRALPITQAQLAAGRSLTEYLRTRWSVPPDMCVTHGLTSVNPKKHLIGHHLDWARGFPFDAFGLPDQYTRPAPAVALFGFGYDDRFLGVMGEPWAGVRTAEGELEREAAARGVSLELLRRDKTGLFDRWLAEQAGDAKEPGRAEDRAEGRTPAPADRDRRASAGADAARASRRSSGG
jgi:hypothetical protein